MKSASRPSILLRTWMRSRGSLSVAGDFLDDALALPVLRALKHRTRKDLQHLFANALASDKHQPLLACIAALLVCLGLVVSLVPLRPLWSTSVGELSYP